MHGRRVVPDAGTGKGGPPSLFVFGHVLNSEIAGSIDTGLPLAHAMHGSVTKVDIPVDAHCISVNDVTWMDDLFMMACRDPEADLRTLAKVAGSLIDSCRR